MHITITADMILKAERAARREAARKAGYYDGRNAPRKTKNRKREASRLACRGRVEQ